MEISYTLITESSAETEEFGIKLAELLESPALILLKGDLGTGKTLITKAAVSALGYQGEVTSPTFNLVQEYQAEIEIIHMDLYRLDRSEELLEIGFEDYLNRDAVIFIEWPELALSLIPADFIFINIEKLSAEKRKITVRGEGDKSRLLIERLNQKC
jgi:tRNA threonylcarbamoyladenosine biosynthesis protein TsaE